MITSCYRMGVTRGTISVNGEPFEEELRLYADVKNNKTVYLSFRCFPPDFGRYFEEAMHTFHSD